MHLANSIVPCIDRKQIDMLPFADEIDSNNTFVRNEREEYEEEGEISGKDMCHDKLPYYVDPAKGKRGALPHAHVSKKKAAQKVPPPGNTAIFDNYPESAAANIAAVPVATTTT